MNYQNRVPPPLWDSDRAKPNSNSTYKDNKAHQAEAYSRPVFSHPSRTEHITPSQRSGERNYLAQNHSKRKTYSQRSSGTRRSPTRSKDNSRAYESNRREPLRTSYGNQHGSSRPNLQWREKSTSKASSWNFMLDKFGTLQSTIQAAQTLQKVLLENKGSYKVKPGAWWHKLQHKFLKQQTSEDEICWRRPQTLLSSKENYHKIYLFSQLNFLQSISQTLKGKEVGLT